MENNLNSPKQINNKIVADDEIDLRELFSAIWQGKWFIIAITALFAASSVFYAMNQPNIYKSEALLAPAEQEQQGGLGALAGQFGGLASLAGVSLGAGGGVDKTQMALEVLKSRKFTSEFIQKHNILPDLMAVKSWNLVTNTLSYNTEIYNPQNKNWLRAVKAPKKSEPSMQEAYKVLSKLISVDVDSETGMITLAVEHQSPVVAQQWVTWLIHDINKSMKQRDVIEANKSTEFLTKQLNQIKIADIRIVLYKLIEEQTKTIMFANVRDEYIFKTIDPALVPEEKNGPKRALICVIAIFLGGILSMMFVLSRAFLGQKENKIQ